MTQHYFVRRSTGQMSIETRGSDSQRSSGSRRSHRSRPQGERVSQPVRSPVRHAPASVRMYATQVEMLQNTDFNQHDIFTTGNLEPSSFQFVMEHARWLRQLGLQPQDIIATARLPVSNRSFAVDHAESLVASGFRPAQLIQLADMTTRPREFIAVHHQVLRQTGMRPSQMLKLVLRSESKWRRALPRQGSEPSATAGSRSTAGSSHRPAGPARHSSRNSVRHAERHPDNAGGIRRAQTQPLADNQFIAAAPARSTTLPGNWQQRGTAGPSEQYRVYSSDDGFDIEQFRDEESDDSHGAEQATARQGLRRTFAPVAQSGHAPVITPPARRGTDPVLSSSGYHHVDEDEELARALQASQLDSQPSAGAAPAPAFSAPARAATMPVYSHVDTSDDEELAAAIRASMADHQPTTAESSGATTSLPIQRSHPRNTAALSHEEQLMLRHAAIRWGEAVVTEAMCERFYRDVKPENAPFSQAAQPNLCQLLSAQACTTQCRADTAGHTQRAKAVTDYLVNADDAGLIRDCEAEAERAVGTCSDRVIYGMTQLEQVVLQHKIEHNLLSPKVLFKGIEATFLQYQVENIAADLFARNHPGSNESIEFYLQLSMKLKERGWNLTESATSTRYVIHRVTDDELQTAEDRLSRHCHDLSDDYLAEYSGKVAVEQTLKRLFPEDFATMNREREERSESADDRLLSPDSTPAQRSAAVSELEALGGMEKAWYQNQLKVVLRNPALLDNFG